MGRRSGRRQPRANGSAQKLVHTHYLEQTTSSVTVTASNLGLLGIQTEAPCRPCRPANMVLQVAGTTGGVFRYLVIAGNGEEIYGSPLIAYGTAPKTIRTAMPSSTDYSLYPYSAAAVIIITKLSGSSLNVAVNMTFQYKFPTTVRPAARVGDEGKVHVLELDEGGATEREDRETGRDYPKEREFRE